jgi:type IV pilus assembly protein PilZ
MVDRISEFDARVEPRVIKTLSVSYKDKQSFLMAYTSNISTGGLFIKTNNPLEPNEQFLLKLQLPDFPEPLKLQSQVVWANRDNSGEDKRPIGMGIKFLDAAGSDFQTLKKYVDSVMMQE